MQTQIRLPGHRAQPDLLNRDADGKQLVPGRLHSRTRMHRRLSRNQMARRRPLRRGGEGRS